MRRHFKKKNFLYIKRFRCYIWRVNIRIFYFLGMIMRSLFIYEGVKNNFLFFKYLLSFFKYRRRKKRLGLFFIRRPFWWKLKRKGSSIAKLTHYFLSFKRTVNNIFITVSSFNGNVILMKSAGSMGIKGTKKKRPYSVIEDLSIIVGREMRRKSIYYISCFYVYGCFVRYPPKFIALRIYKALKLQRIRIFSFIFLKSKAHNGVRSPVARRV